MKIRFVETMTLEVVTGLDTAGEPITVDEIFHANMKTEIDKIDDNEIQFGDGSVAFVNGNFWKAVEILES